MEIHKLEDYDWEFVQSLIKNNIEESINLDFKSAEALSKIDSKKKEISKDVSAFANSNGGVIIYGIDEIDHKASSISFVDGNEYTKEWLEQVISSTIQRNIPNLKIFPIRKEGLITQTVYIVQIPESMEAPHICKDKKFYKRYNFESVAMEEYEVRQLYNRKVKSKLQLSGYSVGLKEVTEDIVSFTVKASVINEGDIVEKDYKVNIYFQNVSDTGLFIKWETSGKGKDYHVTVINDERVKITGDGTSTIYPNEKIDIITFFFEIPKNKVKQAFEKLELEFKLYYINGEDQMEANLKTFYEQIKDKL